MDHTDVLIIGSGIAGATAALRLARNPQRQILVLTREPDPQEFELSLCSGRHHLPRPGRYRRPALPGYPGCRRRGQLPQSCPNPGGGGPASAARSAGRPGRHPLRQPAGRRARIRPGSRPFAPAHPARGRWHRPGHHYRVDRRHAPAPQYHHPGQLQPPWI